MNESCEDKPDISLHPPTIFISALLIGFIIRAFAGGWLPLPHLVAEALGGVMLLGSLMLAVGAISAFAEAGETLRPATPAHQLFTAGPYRFSRNPIYLAMVVFGAGFGVATLNLWVIMMSFATGAIFNFFVIPEEERYLARRFGPEFEQYRQRTRRWL